MFYDMLGPDFYRSILLEVTQNTRVFCIHDLEQYSNVFVVSLPLVEVPQYV